MWPPTILYNLFARGYKGRGGKEGGHPPFLLLSPLPEGHTNGDYTQKSQSRAEQGRKGEGERKKYPVAKSTGKHPTLLFPGEVKKQDWGKYSTMISVSKYYIGGKMRKAILRIVKCDSFLSATKKIPRLPSSTFPKKNFLELKNDLRSPCTCRPAKADSLWTGREKYDPLPPFWTFDLPRFCVNKCSV